MNRQKCICIDLQDTDLENIDVQRLIRDDPTCPLCGGSPIPIITERINDDIHR